MKLFIIATVLVSAVTAVAAAGELHDPTVMAAAAVIVIGALSAATVAIIKAVSAMKSELMKLAAEAAEKAREASNKADEAVRLADAARTLAAKEVEKIHVLVNNSATVAAKKIEVLEQQVKDLLGQLSRIQEQRVSEAKARPAQENP